MTEIDDFNSPSCRNMKVASVIILNELLLICI